MTFMLQKSGHPPASMNHLALHKWPTINPQSSKRLNFWTVNRQTHTIMTLLIFNVKTFKVFLSNIF